MDITTKPQRLRIVSGRPAEVEAELNQLLESYSAAVWNIGPGAQGAIVTVVLLHESVIRQQQIAAARMAQVVNGGARFSP